MCIITYIFSYIYVSAFIHVHGSYSNPATACQLTQKTAKTTKFCCILHTMFKISIDVILLFKDHIVMLL